MTPTWDPTCGGHNGPRRGDQVSLETGESVDEEDVT